MMFIQPKCVFGVTLITSMASMLFGTASFIIKPTAELAILKNTYLKYDHTFLLDYDYADLKKVYDIYKLLKYIK